MSELESQYVKRGYWVNVRQGPIMGQTLTTDTRTGAFVIALLAVFASMGLKHLWNLVTFAIHQYRANGCPSDGLYRQQQVLLRTSPTPSAFMAEAVTLWYIWRRISDRAAAKLILPALLALVFIAGTLAASIFSSYVVSTSNLEVLVSSPECGYLDFSEGYWDSYFSSIQKASGSYADDCYLEGTSLPGRCNIYTRPNIHINSEKVPCPFEEGICKTSAVALDSGVIDISDAMGLNLAADDRIGYRKRTTCSILSLEGHTVVVNATELPVEMLGRNPLPGEEIEKYCYGAIPNFPDFNCTFGHSLTGANYKAKLEVVANTDYVHKDGFKVLPALHRDDADVVLKLILKNRVQYLNPVDDPMFAAHRQANLSFNNGEVESTYQSDTLGAMVGCAVQYQYCFQTPSNKSHCSELGGLDLEMSNETWRGANDVQLAIAKLLRNSAYILDIGDPETFKVQSAYADSAGLIDVVPDEQWITELKGWEETVWAAHQIAITDYAIGPTVRDAFAANYTLGPSTKAEKLLCKSQKMRRSGGFVNINIFGLVFTITVASIITLIDLILLRSFTSLKKFNERKSPRIDRWIQDGVYQLQRRVYEARGEGIWVDLTSENPFTIESTKLQDLPIESALYADATPPQETQAQFYDDSKKWFSQETVSKEADESIERVRQSQDDAGPAKSDFMVNDPDSPTLFRREEDFEKGKWEGSRAE